MEEVGAAPDNRETTKIDSNVFLKLFLISVFVSFVVTIRFHPVSSI